MSRIKHLYSLMAPHPKDTSVDWVKWVEKIFAIWANLQLIYKVIVGCWIIKVRQFCVEFNMAIRTRFCSECSPILPHLPPEYKTQMLNLGQHMPCKTQTTGFSAQDTQSIRECLNTHNLRPGPWQAHGSSLHTNQYAPHDLVSHGLTSTDEGFFIHTFKCSGVSPQLNITAASGYFYMHTIIRLHPTGQSQEMQQLHCLS